jgi:ATP synthase protein I
MKSVPERKALSIAKPRIMQWLVIELLVLCLIAAGVAVSDGVVAKSLLCGGLTALVPQLYFAYQVYRYQGARVARLMTYAFYHAEAGKFFLTSTLFIMVFALIRPVNALVVLLSFAAWQFINWIGAAALLKRYRASASIPK